MAATRKLTASLLWLCALAVAQAGCSLLAGLKASDQDELLSLAGPASSPIGQFCLQSRDLTFERLGGAADSNALVGEALALLLDTTGQRAAAIAEGTAAKQQISWAGPSAARAPFKADSPEAGKLAEAGQQYSRSLVRAATLIDQPLGSAIELSLDRLSSEPRVAANALAAACQELTSAGSAVAAAFKLQQVSRSGELTVGELGKACKTAGVLDSLSSICRGAQTIGPEEEQPGKGSAALAMLTDLASWSGALGAEGGQLSAQQFCLRSQLELAQKVASGARFMSLDMIQMLLAAFGNKPAHSCAKEATTETPETHESLHESQPSLESNTDVGQPEVEIQEPEVAESHLQPSLSRGLNAAGNMLARLLAALKSICSAVAQAAIRRLQALKRSLGPQSVESALRGACSLLRGYARDMRASYEAHLAAGGAQGSAQLDGMSCFVVRALLKVNTICTFVDTAKTALGRLG